MFAKMVAIRVHIITFAWTTAREQAYYFLDQVHLTDGDLPPVLDIYIIPDASAENGYGSGRKLFIRPFLPSVRDLLITAGILSCITLIGFLFLQLDFARYNIITFYMLGVLFTALCTSGYTCGVLGSIASVALYNFFFHFCGVTSS